jgi:hypothetical protein
VQKKAAVGWAGSVGLRAWGLRTGRGVGTGVAAGDEKGTVELAVRRWTES